MKKYLLFKEKNEFSLFLISFMILFLELICIRWVSSTIRYIGFFNNLILLAAFLGIGLGCILQDKKKNLFDYFPVVISIFILMLSLGVLNSTIQSRALITKTDALLYKTPLGLLTMDPSIVLALIFIFVVLMFTSLSQELGRLFPRYPPLKAYSLNILGSLGGIAVFSIMSYISLSPVIWFSILYVTLFLFKPFKRINTVYAITFILLLPATLGPIYVVSQGLYETVWSPYYKITKQGNNLAVNNIGHQNMLTAEEAGIIWHFPYQEFNETFQDVLIIGSGSGTDVAVALYHNVSHIDAVEIDPKIIELGRKYHPTNPYSNPKVEVINDDGRSYLMKTKKKYDLIIYGLTDSLTVLSNYGSLRLESYLYTVDAFREVKKHLKEDGVFVTANQYPRKWFGDKLGLMLEEAFNQKPYVIYGDNNGILTLSGPKTGKLRGREPYTPSNDVTSATDNWPFFYIKNPSMPSIYLNVLFIITLITVIFFLIMGPKRYLSRISPHFFFLGAAFMLLETKSIINFSLLYGATWLVNSLVFFSILLMVLLAVYFVEKHPTGDIRMWYLALFLLLLLNYLIPSKVFLMHDYWGRYIISSIFFFSPIFVANIIFSHSFKYTKKSPLDYASNILGSMLGGIVEYISLMTGYQSLVIFVGVFYFLAFYKRR